MQDQTLQDAVEITSRALERLERQVQNHARTACRNALLQLAPSHLVFPSPAAGIMEMAPASSYVLPAGTRFRSIEALLPEGEAFLTPVAEEMKVHPWRVEEADWIPCGGDDHDGMESGVCRGFSVVLGRESSHAADPGWLSLHVAGGEILRGLLADCRVFIESRNVPSRRWHPERDSLGSPLSGRVMDSLGHNLLQVAIPSNVCSETELRIIVRFQRPLPAPEADRKCQVRSNAIPVWNCLESRYPGPRDVRQVVSGNQHSLIHPLPTGHLGSGWHPWKIIRVGGSRGMPFRRRSSLDRPLGHQSPPSYDLALVSPILTASEKPTANRDSLTLGVVLSPAARSGLDELGEDLRVDYQACQGTRANGFPDGSEFQIVPGQAANPDGGHFGKLIGQTWGGSDGLLGINPDSADEMASFPILRQGQLIRIEEIELLVEMVMGHVIELISPSDFLSSGEGPLLVRFRFRNGRLTTGEKAAIQLVLSGFLREHLGLQVQHGLHLVEDCQEAGR
jgi:hypothetical protein